MRSIHRLHAARGVEPVARGEIDRLGLESETTLTSHFEGHPTFTCQLRRGESLLATGHGRGASSDARSAALLEALEHYWIGAADRPRERLDFATLAAQPALAGDQLIQRMGSELGDSHVLGNPYVGEGVGCLYPEFVVNPTNLRETEGEQPWVPQYSRYSSSIGTALGSTAEEARLNGALELIEHDAFSLAILKWFVLGHRAISVVARGKYPIEAADLCRRLDDAGEEDFVLIDLTNDIEIPCYAAIRHVAGGASHAGLGCALNGTEAAMRALTELAQVITLETGESDAAQVAALARWPVLQACRDLVVDPSWPGIHHVDLQPDLVGPQTSLAEQLGLLSAKLLSRGIQLFHRSLTDPSSALWVTSSIAPGLERFSLVRYGNPVIPNGRGYALWAQALAR